MTLPLVLPILIPLVGAALALLSWRSRAAQAFVGVASAVGLLASVIDLTSRIASRGPAATQMGDWPAPYGITLVADLLSCAMLLMSSVLGVCVATFSIGSLDRRTRSHLYFPCLLVLLTGCSGAFLTGDIFNLYVWFEILIISSFVLLTLGGTRRQLEGAVKYVALNLLSSGLFLAGVGVLYGMAGTLNLADLHVKLAQVDRPRELTAVAVLFLLGFGLKAAVFPLYFWLPASYNAPPPVIGALFAGILSKVGVYSIVRTCLLVFTQEHALLAQWLLALGSATMVLGVFGAAVQGEMRRILAYHSVSQIGYMIAGFGVVLLTLSRGQPELAALALAAVVFFMAHHTMVKSNLFLAAGAVLRARGTTELAPLGGLVKGDPLLAALFLVPALSLAGMPLLSGFWAKLVLVRAGLEAGVFWVVGVSLFTGLLTLYSMTKIWNEVFWKDAPGADPAAARAADDRSDGAAERHAEGSGRAWMLPGMLALTVLTIAAGTLVEPAMRGARSAAGDALNRAAYVRAVLGDPRRPASDAGGPGEARP